MARKQKVFGVFSPNQMMLVMGAILVIGIFTYQLGFLNLYDDGNTDYEPIVLTPEEQAIQRAQTLKIFKLISLTMFLISLLLLGVSPWFFYGLTAGILIK